MFQIRHEFVDFSLFLLFFRSSLGLSESTFFIYKNSFPGEKNYNFFLILLQFFFKLLPKYSDFVNYADFIRKISQISIRNNLSLFETLIFEPMRMNFNLKALDCMLALFSSFFNCFQGLLNIYIQYSIDLTTYKLICHKIYGIVYLCMYVCIHSFMQF